MGATIAPNQTLIQLFFLCLLVLAFSLRAGRKTECLFLVMVIKANPGDVVS